MYSPDRRHKFFDLVETELNSAYEKHGADLWGRHEFKGILTEEVTELVECVDKNKSTDDLVAEMVQVAAMCVRYFETGNRYAPSNLFLHL